MVQRQYLNSSGKVIEPEKYSEKRFAWCRVEFGQIIILVEPHPREPGDDVVLFMPRPGKAPDTAINLTNHTVEELEAMKTIIDAAFEWARPVCEARDKEADNAWNAGDDSHVRNYRSTPQLVFRKRPGAEHGEGVQQRPEGVLEGGGRTDDLDGGVRGSVDGVAEHDSGVGSTEDHESSLDES